MFSQTTSREMMPCRRSRSAFCSSSVGNSSGWADGSSTSWANSTARQAASGRRAHHRCSVDGWPVPDGLLAGGLPVDVLQRQRDLDELRLVPEILRSYRVHLLVPTLLASCRSCRSRRSRRSRRHGTDRRYSEPRRTPGRPGWTDTIARRDPVAEFLPCRASVLVTQKSSAPATRPLTSINIEVAVGGA